MAAPPSEDNAIHSGELGALRLRLDDIRIQEHLRRAERELRQTEHTDLTLEQRRRRQRALDRLHEYWQQGAFPRNRCRPSRTPCFIGANDVPCAMAYLLQKDGREDLVEQVMDTEPTVRLETVEDGPLAEWVEANGLTMAEAARIQPAYPRAVQFATDCDPTTCQLAWAVASVIGFAVAACSEYVGYRLVSGLFPENALKRRATLGYLTVMNLFLVPLVALVTFALFP